MRHKSIEAITALTALILACCLLVRCSTQYKQAQAELEALRVYGNTNGEDDAFPFVFDLHPNE